MKDQGADQKPFRFDFVAAPGDLGPYLNSYYFFESEKPVLEDILPAYSGQLLLPITGNFALIQKDGTRLSTSEPAFVAPLLEAHKIRVEGPALAFGVSLNFRGWAAITGLSVAEHNNGVLRPELGLGEKASTQVRQLVSAMRCGEVARGDLPEAMSAILRECISDLPENHRRVIDATLDWLSDSLSPELDDLYEAAPYSRRQVQRLVKQFFGVSPVHLVRRYRAVRAATILSMPHVTRELEAEILSAFYDQPHMIKEIRRFTGRTPRRLVSDDETIVPGTLDTKGYSSVSPFGSGEEEQLRGAKAS